MGDLVADVAAPGGGDPESQPTRLSVELFDAIMSTWVWTD